MIYVSRGTALVSPLVAGKFWGYREMHWVWMFLSAIPSLGDNGSWFAVNRYIYASTHFQVGYIRIRSLNTSQSDQMREKNKATFLRVEEYIYLHFCPSGELMVMLLLCMFSVWTSRCFSCDICEPQKSKLPFEFSQALGWYQSCLSGQGKLPNTSRQLNLTAMYPQAAC